MFPNAMAGQRSLVSKITTILFLTRKNVKCYLLACRVALIHPTFLYLFIGWQISVITWSPVGCKVSRGEFIEIWNKGLFRLACHQWSRWLWKGDHWSRWEGCKEGNFHGTGWNHLEFLARMVRSSNDGRVNIIVVSAPIVVELWGANWGDGWGYSCWRDQISWTVLSDQIDCGTSLKK